MPPCLCVCALVCLGGGGGCGTPACSIVVRVGTHGAGKCVPGAPGPGREAGEPDAEPAGGDVGLGSQPPCHKDKLPNHSTTACWHRKAVVRGTTGVRPALLDCLRHRWCCHAGWVRLPMAEGVPRAGGGAPGRRECFPALGATGAGCTGCGATARVDEGAQRAPHPNGLSVVPGGGGQGGVRWSPFSGPSPVQGCCDRDFHRGDGPEAPQHTWLKNNPHDVLIILSYVSYGNFFFQAALRRRWWIIITG